MSVRLRTTGSLRIERRQPKPATATLKVLIGDEHHAGPRLCLTPEKARLVATALLKLAETMSKGSA